MYELKCKIKEIVVGKNDVKVKVEAGVEHQFIFDKDHKYNIFYEEGSTDGENCFTVALNKIFDVNIPKIRDILFCNSDKFVSIFIENKDSNEIVKVKING